METSNFSSLVFVSKFVSFYRLILKYKQFVVVMMVLCLRSGNKEEMIQENIAQLLIIPITLDH